MANRFAYLGSVFLPLSMFMIILNTAKIDCKRWVLYLLLGISGVVFLVAASQGYLDIYYKEVSLETIGGFSALKKVYGPLHSLYLVYLVGYFAAMIYAIIYAFRKKSSENTVYTVILAMAVFVNIGVWFVEQIVSIDFEVLSVSYIISEMFLLGLNLLIAESNRLKEQAVLVPAPQADTPKVSVSEEQLQIYREGLEKLTKTERIIYDAYVEGSSTKDVMKLLGITENTLKFHNKNIYGKLGVSSRKQLVEISKVM
jgi:DNA-binding CsgD family transcriptional regulator